MAHEPALRNDSHERSLLGANQLGTITKRIIVNDDGSLAIGELDGDIALERDNSSRVTRIQKTLPDGTVYQKVITRDTIGDIIACSRWNAASVTEQF